MRITLKVKTSVFGSKWERKLYKSLETSWPDQLVIYPSLPFLSVIDWSGAKLQPFERNFLKSTSLDYTACEVGTDRPLLSVEFDGLGHGFSREGKYHEVVGGPSAADPYRRDKLNLKLRLATEVGYPLFVVSYEEASPIDDDELTITHGLIGSYFSRVFTQERLNELSPQIEWPDDPQETQDMIDDLVISTEVDMMFQWNPLVVREAQAWRRAQEAGARGWKVESFTDPPEANQAGASLRESMIAFQKANRVGCRITVQGPDRAVSREAWVRNVEDAFTSASIAELIAKIAAARAFASDR